MRIEGVHVAVVTPFKKDLSLDKEAFERFLGSIIGTGIHGIVPCGTTGETPTLSDDERRWVISKAVEIAAPPDLLVTAGCGANSTEKTITLINEAKELGAKAALVVTPYYNKPGKQGVLAHFLKIADSSELPIILYNVPPRTNVNLTPDMVFELFKHEKIIGIKEASGDHGQWLKLTHLVDTKKKNVLSGDDDCFATLLALGGSGIISASANVVPKYFVEIFNAHRSGDYTKAFELQKEFIPLKEALFAETNPTPIKFALSTMGKMENVVRLPLVPVMGNTEKLITETLHSWKDRL